MRFKDDYPEDNNPKETEFDVDFVRGGGGGGGQSDQSSKAHETMQTVSRHQLIYSVLGLLTGILMTLGGLVLFLNGVAGSSSWTVSLLSLESDLSDAAPGTILFVVGLAIVLVTRYEFKVKK